MRRPHVLVLGVVVALGLAGCAGCARPVAGQASYQVGAAAGAGDGANGAATSPPTASRSHRPTPKRTRRPAHHTAPPTTPPAPPQTHSEAPPTPKKKPSQTSDPAAPTLEEFSVCLSLFQISRAPDGAFRSLPRHASMSSRSHVARSYTSAYQRMMKVLKTSGLPPDDVVRLQAMSVASATRAMARALPSGSGVSNRRLRAAFVKLTQLCTH
jgi:hypothetical protein